MSVRGRRATLALLGLRGSGKSTVGRALAGELGLAFVDLDERVLETGRRAGHAAGSAGELLARAGQAVFRELEATALRCLLEPSPGLVLATGGGVVERADNRTWLARTTRGIHLCVPNAILAARLAADPTLRPPLTGLDPRAELELLAARREPHYHALAEVVLAVGDEPPAELAARIRRALGH